MQALKFIILNSSYSIHRLQPDAAIPRAVFGSLFYSITKTDNELSLVVPEIIEIDAENTDTGWRVLKVVGTLEFSLTGILAGISTALAQVDVSIFAISTFDTDYILVKDAKLKTAKEALLAAGHKFVRTPQKPVEKDENFLQRSYSNILVKQIPLIKNLITEKLGPSALVTLRSEAALAVAVGSLYEFLPAPVRLVANREAFVSFCVHNLDKILPVAPKPKGKTKTAR